MLLNSDFDIIKKASLLVILLVTPMLVQAQASDAAVTTAEAETAEASANEDQQRAFSFPRWPESRSITRERIPSAPPGPYMSSALSDYSFKEHSFDRDFDRDFDRVRSRRASRMDPPDMSMEKFSPDAPWPSHAKSPERWQPENGYRYVDPRVKNKPYQVKPYNSTSNYNYGYKRPAAMNWPDRRSGRNMPVMSNPAN